MQLLKSSEIPKTRVERTFRHPVLAHLIMLALFGGGPAVGLYLTRPWEAVSEAHWVFLIAAAPVVLIMALVWILIVCFIVHCIQGSLRPSNWLMKVTRDGVYLKFRSYSNWHFDGDQPMVVYLPLESIDSAGKVVEWTHTAPCSGTTSNSGTTQVRPFLELQVRGLETDGLRQAIARERKRKGPEKSFLGVRSSGRSNHAPVLVPEPGVIRVDWHGKAMLRPFAKRSEILPKRTVRVGYEPPTETADDTLEEAA